MTTATPIPSAPGPRAYGRLGATAQAMRFSLRPVHTAGRLFARYGDVVSVVRAPIRIVNPGPEWGEGALKTARGAGVVVVNGAEHNREVLTQHDRYHSIALSGRLYPTDPNPAERLRPLTRMMTGLFHVNSDEHRRHRRLLMPAFQKTRIDAYRDDMVAIADEMRARYRAGEVRDVHADMTEITLRIATKTLFGEDEGARGLELARHMQEWLLTLFSPLNIFARADVRGLPYARFLDLTRAIDAETRAIVQAKRARAGSDRDMLSTLISTRDEDDSSLDEDELIGHVGVIFGAGHETSTNALAWTLFLLSQHLDVLADLTAEIDAILRGAPPSVEDLARMPLLDGVVKESLRVLPPVPLHPRIVAQDCELGGHHLPAGSELFLSIYHMHRDGRVFSDPAAFRPKRWETVKPTVFEYNPFSAGPRMCIGAAFATMEIKIVLAVLLQHFRFELPDGAKVSPRIAITMAPQGGLPMRVLPRTARVKRGTVGGSIASYVRLPS